MTQSTDTVVDAILRRLPAAVRTAVEDAHDTDIAEALGVMTRERNDAWEAAIVLERQIEAVREALGAGIGEGFLEAAKRVVAESNDLAAKARQARDFANIHMNEVRHALGADPAEHAVNAAVRIVFERNVARAERDNARAERDNAEAQYSASRNAVREALEAGATEHVLDAAKRVMAERDALKSDLARVSEELGLPPGIGPAAGEIRKLRMTCSRALAALASIKDIAKESCRCATCPACRVSKIIEALS